MSNARKFAAMQKLKGSKPGSDRVLGLSLLSVSVWASVCFHFIMSGLPLSYCLATFSDGCLGSNNDEGRSEV